MRRKETVKVIGKNDKSYTLMSMSTSSPRVYSGVPIACYSQEVIRMENVHRDSDGSLSVGEVFACVIETKPNGKEFVYADHSVYTFLGKKKSTDLSPLRKALLQEINTKSISAQRQLSAFIKAHFDGSEASLKKICELTSLEAEHKRLEYKLCFEEINPKIMQSIGGLANAEGGKIVLGVGERDGRWVPLGCERCITRYGGHDRFSCVLRNMCRQQVSTPLFLDIEITFRECQGHTLCEINVPASEKPVFVSDEYYVRADNTTQHLKGDELLDYVLARKKVA